MSKSINDLVSKFAHGVVKQDEAPNATQGNKFAREYILDSFMKLISRFGDKGRDALSILMEDDDPRIRCMTAAFLLRYKHKEAVEVLENLAAGKGLPAFAASCSLDNWEKGIWELDPEPREREKKGARHQI